MSVCGCVSVVDCPYKKGGISCMFHIDLFFLFVRRFAEAIITVLQRSSIDISSVSLIGSHGELCSNTSRNNAIIVNLNGYG